VKKRDIRKEVQKYRKILKEVPSADRCPQCEGDGSKSQSVMQAPILCKGCKGKGK